MLCFVFENCASCFGVEHIFEKIVKTYGLNVKKHPKEMETLMRICAGLVGDAYMCGLGGTKK